MYSGYVTLNDGTQIYVEYYDRMITRSVSNMDHLQDSLEYIAARVCEEASINYIQIRYSSYESAVEPS